ncbi:MAG: Gfo/Idh/MocA family oxidoreductase [Tepidisphaeraceae bacterium]|jgi:predicted dehydrogenase
MNVAIVGCGLIGQKRLKALGAHRLVAASDVQIDRARKLSQGVSPAPTVSADWREIVRREDVNIVIVATTNDALAEITLAAVQAGKHVLVEKPAARNAAELEPVITAAKAKGVVVKVGFNHRFHPALWKAKEIFDSGQCGPLMFMRGRYGHGGRVGYDREWRADPAIAGGGEMLDQGVHLVDLSRWFAGDFTRVSGQVGTFFWDMPVEDNGFAILTTAKGQVAFLHASCSEWKNLFCLEIYGRTGKLQIDGLGGSYGVERLSFYKMLPEMGPPPTTIWEFPGEDKSWNLEFADFLDCIDNHRAPCGDLHDAIAALRVIEELYSISPKPGGSRA